MNTEQDNYIDTEYKESLKDFKFEFGSPDHIRIVTAMKIIAKNEKAKQTPKLIEDTKKLRETVIWLIKMDF